MPHPERYLDLGRDNPYWTRLDASVRKGPTPGLRMFMNAVEAAANRAGLDPVDPVAAPRGTGYFCGGKAMGSTNSNSAPLPATSLAGAAGVPRLYGEIIQDDRICPGCSYNLKGMRTGERCPECASPIPDEGQHAPRLDDDSVGQLSTCGDFHTGACGCLAAGQGYRSACSGPALPSQPRATSRSLWRAWRSSRGAGWVLGVFKVTTHRPQEPGNPGTRVAEWRGLRGLPA